MIHETTDKLDFNKIKNLCSVKNNVKKLRKEATDREKMFTKDTSFFNVFFFFFFYYYGCIHSIWKFTGQGSNPCLCSNLSCCSQILNPLCHCGTSSKRHILIKHYWSSLVAQKVKDPALSPLWLRLLL